ncbi:MAG: HPr family phosphocarrier protein [Defluviitaleaceae bacterium]|nr:HPr family phosphocarrier protein [Defluviitaleaceae bacterium]
MKSKKTILPFKEGLQAKPASEITNFLRNFNSNVTMNYKGRIGNCKSIISLLSLCVPKQEEVEIIFEGENEEQEIVVFFEFLENGEE